MKAATLTFVAGLLAAGAAHAEQTLTADEVARRAKATSPALAARRAEVAAAEAAVTEAQAAWLPRLVGLARYARLSSLTSPTLGNIVVTPEPGDISVDNFPVAVAFRFPVVVDHYQFQASAALPLGDYLLRLPAATAAAHASAAAVVAEQRAAEARLCGDARALYFSWARARLQHEVAVSAREQARAHLEQVSAAREAGRHTEADVLRVESQLAASELVALRTANLAGLLEDQLRTVLHDGAGETYAVGGDVAPAASFELLDEEAAYRRALAQRAELAALAHVGAREQAQARATRALLLPRLEAFGAVLSANPNPRFFPPQDRFHTTWELGLQVSFSPNDLAAGLAIARRHRARAAAAEAERQALAESLRAEVLAATRGRQESTAALATTARGLKAAEESYRVRLALFTEGRSTSVELTDAETELVRARFAAIDARIDAALAGVALNKALGDTSEEGRK